MFCHSSCVRKGGSTSKQCPSIGNRTAHTLSLICHAPNHEKERSVFIFAISSVGYQFSGYARHLPGLCLWNSTGNSLSVFIKWFTRTFYKRLLLLIFLLKFSTSIPVITHSWEELIAVKLWVKFPPPWLKIPLDNTVGQLLLSKIGLFLILILKYYGILCMVYWFRLSAFRVFSTKL